MQSPVSFWGKNDPLPPVTDYVLWLDFSDPFSIILFNLKNPEAATGSGSYIKMVVDKSPLLRHAAATPSVDLTGMKYVPPSLGYNGRSVGMSDGKAILKGDWSQYVNWTLLMVYHQISSARTTNGMRIFSHSVKSGTNKTYVPMAYMSTAAVITYSTSGSAASGVTLSPNSWHRLIHRKTMGNTVNTMASTNSSPDTIDQLNELNTTTPLEYNIAGQHDSSTGIPTMMNEGIYAEIIAFPRVLSAKEISDMDVYFSAKWGSNTLTSLASDHALTASEMHP